MESLSNKGYCYIGKNTTPCNQVYLKRLFIQLQISSFEFKHPPSYICSYQFDYYDILFFIKHIKYPTDNFNIFNHVTFSHGSTRSSSHSKLHHKYSASNLLRNSYFCRLPKSGILFHLLILINRLHQSDHS